MSTQADTSNPHGDVLDLLGAWAVGACDDDEIARIDRHLRECERCGAQAARLTAAASWLGADQLRPPPESLRARVLAQARERRAPAPLRTLTEAYAGQIALLDQALDSLGPEDWQRQEPRHRDVAGLLAHLTANDALLATDLDLPVIAIPGHAGPGARTAWRRQAQILTNGLRTGPAAATTLDRRVRLTTKRAPRPGRLRDALVQRAFETWTHLDDLGAVFGRVPSVPPPEQVRRILDLAMRLLPAALREHGLSRPGRAGRIVLSGAGGGEWTVPLGSTADAGIAGGAADVTIEADAVEFARLVANRRSPGTLRHTVRGDDALAPVILHVASQLGCD
jgi:uncharacterized protein (TIGR03083 family)